MLPFSTADPRSCCGEAQRSLHAPQPCWCAGPARFLLWCGSFMRMYPCCSANFEMSTHVSRVCLHCCLNLTMATCVTCLQSVEVKNFLISGAQIVYMVSFADIRRYSRYYLLFFSSFSFCLTAYSPQLHPQKHAFVSSYWMKWINGLFCLACCHTIRSYGVRIHKSTG